MNRIQERFRLVTRNGTEPLFTTDTPEIWRVYLDSFPIWRRQHQDCRACKAFLQRYGGLVTIDPMSGQTRSVFWNPEDALTLQDQQVLIRLRMYVAAAPVTGLFLTATPIWGTPRTDRRASGQGDWRHFAILAPDGAAALLATAATGMASVDRARLAAAGKTAQKARDFERVVRALTTYRPEHLAWAVELLMSQVLYQSERVLGPARWLRDLQANARASSRFANVVWRAVATAPPGFCRPRSTMIGTLLEDLAAGLSLDEVRRRFAAKMDPTRYLRPSAPPASGNINRAEKLVHELGLAPSLQRRFARLEDVREWVWRPAAVTVGVFSRLQPPVAPDLGLPRVMTWTKFRNGILGAAAKLEVSVQRTYPFAALVTAVNPTAPPILQWDHEDRRNPMSWYLHPLGLGWYASRWSLVANAWVSVTGVCEQPSMWHGGGFRHVGEAVFLLLQGCRDTAPVSLCLFPGVLKNELWEVRSVIEAYSNSGRMEGASEATACGLRLQKGALIPVHVRVTSAAGIVSEYVIDRWD